MKDGSFETQFARLTGSHPFPWQSALYQRFLAGDIPTSCDIPTGLGKTSVIAIWLLARAAGALLPRRLVYVVNRRTVVDQTTAEIRKLHANAADAGTETDLALSTLRGQMADNRAWSADPSRPAVICGTVDMIGSRLLFSGYRIGFRARPLHAGFLGQDALIVHDEAHLEPAFQALLESVQAEQARCGDPWPLRLMALSATSRNVSAALRLGPEDVAHPVVAQRVRATKKLSLHALGERRLVEAVVERALAFQSSGRAVVVFLRTVEDVKATIARLMKAGLQVRQLTGTMRGFERDQLVATDAVFERFLNRDTRGNAQPIEAAFLVCTSAGEVGVNLSADHLICDLSTFDSIAQRFGRLNRFGLREDAEAHVFHPDESSLSADKAQDAPARRATLALLRQLDGDASPAALAALDAELRRAAFAPEPRMLEATDILFDAWSTTTIWDAMPGRPPVEPFLHGVAEWEPPTTQVAWRDEVGVVRGELLAQYPPQDLIDDYPLKPHELLTDRTSRVLDTLEDIAQRSEADAFPVWVLDEQGHVAKERTLATLLSGNRREDERRLSGCTVLLPPQECRPVGGTLSAEGLGGSDPGDVADEWRGDGDVQLRSRIFGDHSPPAGMRLIRSITLADEDASGDVDAGAALASWSWYELPRAADNDGSRSASRPVLLEVHGADVEREAARIVEGLALDSTIKQAVVVAARLHDIGKARRVWQLSIGNRDRSLMLAKSGGGMRPLDITAYRHELGSVLDAEDHALCAPLSEEQRDLVLHLIAAHHGRARPHFPAGELFDPETLDVDMADVGARVVDRFARLQKRFGRWGLAYLESLVRAADYAASANPSTVVSP